MTIESQVKCDGLGCSGSRDLAGMLDEDIEAAGYHSDPRDRSVQYCNKCWPEASKEILIELKKEQQSYEYERSSGID